MQEAVSSILIGRSREADGLSRMLMLSLGAHLVFIVGLAVIPSSWLTSEVDRPERAMMISMASPPGTQDTGGMTPMAARNVQQQTADARNTVRTPANTPEMVAPAPEAKPTTAKPVPKPPEKTTAKAPSTGKQVQTGPARADTPATSQPAFGGLSQSSAGGTGGARVEGDFCCPEYIEAMKRAIYSHWNQQAGTIATNEIKFTIRRDGMIVNATVEKSSGNAILDLESRRAVLQTTRIEPLPDRYPHPSLTVYLIFEYKR